MTTTSTLTDQLAPLVDELAQVLSTKADLDTRERDLKTRIRELVPGPDSYDAGTATLVVAANTRFDPKKALELLEDLPEDLRRHVTRTETVVDRDKVRALLPAVFDAAQTVGDYRISVRS